MTINMNNISRLNIQYKSDSNASKPKVDKKSSTANTEIERMRTKKALLEYKKHMSKKAASPRGRRYN